MEDIFLCTIFQVRGELKEQKTCVIDLYIIYCSIQIKVSDFSFLIIPGLTWKMFIKIFITWIKVFENFYSSFLKNFKSNLHYLFCLNERDHFSQHKCHERELRTDTISSPVEVHNTGQIFFIRKFAEKLSKILSLGIMSQRWSKGW